MTSTILELALDNETIPLAKRIEHSIGGKTGKVKTYDRWGDDMDAITDPNTGFTALMVAAKAGNLATLEVLVNRGADPNHRTNLRGRTALHIAAKYGQVEACQALLGLGAAVDMLDFNSASALMHASKAGYEEVVVLLLKRGAGVNLTDRNGISSLHLACKFGHRPVCEILCAAGAAMNIQDSKEGKTPLMYAAQFGRRETLRFLISKGVDLNTTSNLDGITALMLASREGHKGVLVDLIEAGADGSMVNNGGWTALLFAAAAGRKDTALLLLERGGVDINFSDTRSGGYSALTVASRSAQANVVKLLLQLGATIDAKDVSAGMTPLMHASRHDAALAMACLIDHQADINLRDKKGLTPLMHACIHGSSQAIVELVNAFVDVNVTDKEVKSAFDHALIHGHRSLFLSALMNVNSGAKVPFLSWLERECPKMKRGTDLGNPSVYLNAFLYGSNGLYAGMYLRSREYDNEIIGGLVMLAAAFKRSAEADPFCAPDMEDKLDHVNKMLAECLKARSMAADESIANSLLLLKAQIYREEYDIIELSPALLSGPLALCIDIHDTEFVHTHPIASKINLMMNSCLRRPPGFTNGMQPSLLGCLSTSWWLRMRYWPKAVLIMTEFPRVLVLFMICITVQNENNAVQASQLIVLMTVCMLIYEAGEMEDKFNSDWPSVLLDRSVLIERRWKKFSSHFSFDVWKQSDALAYILLILWAFAWTQYSLTESLPLLSLAALPLSFGLLRVPCVLYEGVGRRVLLCLATMKIVWLYFQIIALTAIGFGIALFVSFGQESLYFHNGGWTLISLFEAMYGTLRFEELGRSQKLPVGVFILGLFSIWASTGIFTAIIAHVTSKFESIDAENAKNLSLWRAKVLQQCALVNERSPLWMLPAPFNMLPASLYVLHYFLLNASLLIPGRTRHLSLAGWVCDILLGLLFLPIAYSTAFFSTLSASSYSRSIKMLLFVFSPLLIAINSIVLVLTFGWIPSAVYVLPRRVKWSRMNRICYDDRRDRIVKVGLAEVAPPAPEIEPDLNADEEPSLDGYEGFVDMDERNLHYYGMLLFAKAMSGVAWFMRWFYCVRNVMIGRSGSASVSDVDSIGRYANTSPGKSGGKRKTTFGAENDDFSLESDDEEFETYYNEVGAPVSRPVVYGHHHASSNQAESATSSFTRKKKKHPIPYKGVLEEYQDDPHGRFELPAYADDSAHYAVPMHRGILYSLTERKKIFEIVIPEVVHSEEFALEKPNVVHPSNKSFKEIHSSIN